MVIDSVTHCFILTDNFQPICLLARVSEMEKFIPPPPDFAANIPVQEFGGIIASSEKHRLEAENRRKQVDVDDQGRFVYHMQGKQADIIEEEQPSDWHQRHETLESLRLKLGSRKNKGLLDQVIVAAEPVKQIKQATPNEDRVVQQKNEVHHQPDLMRSTGVVTKDFNPFMVTKKDSDYPLRIDIPPKLWRKNKLYRIRDCFYADDGSFLYRVPGIDRLS